MNTDRTSKTMSLVGEYLQNHPSCATQWGDQAIKDFARWVDDTKSPDETPAPTHRCKLCGALWIDWGASWSLFSRNCGKCCDNAAMGDQIEPLPKLDRLPTRKSPMTNAEELRMLVKMEERSRDYADKAMLAAADKLDRLEEELKDTRAGLAACNQVLQPPERGALSTWACEHCARVNDTDTTFNRCPFCGEFRKGYAEKAAPQ